MQKTLIITVILITASIFSTPRVTLDSDMTFEEAIEGTKAPQEVIDDLELITVRYYGYDSKLHQGQMLVHKDLAGDVKDIFEMIKERKFLVEKCIPIVKYEWSDNASMEDNNSSGFNYRFIAGTKRLSNHSFGRAIDINPLDNPYIGKDGHVSPEGAEYEPGSKGTITGDSFIVKELLKRGWRWGGNWNSIKDYQHFDKAE